MKRPAAVQAVSLCLVHAPDLVRYGSKPSRDIRAHSDLPATLRQHRRTFEEAVAYAPNQVFIGNLTPEDLWNHPEPWFDNSLPDAQRKGRHGTMTSQEDFYCLMKACDDFDLLWLTESFLARTLPTATSNVPLSEEDIKRIGAGHQEAEIEQKVASGVGMAVFSGDEVVGCYLTAHPDDASLEAPVLLENLAAKTSGVLALRQVLNGRTGIKADSIEYLLGCGEEAVGDRYQRGGGSLSKAIGERSGCTNASGSDVKAFCCAPNHAIVMGSALVSGGLFNRVAVTAGGSLAKLGMKYEGHLKHDMPILEDVLGAMAVVLGDDDGESPLVDLDCVGRHTVGAGSSQQAIMESIVVKPLADSGLRLSDVGRFATELHNPEVTLPQGSGNVPRNNYRVLASLAVQKGEIGKEGIESFVREKGMPGFSPTQGHIASAVPYLAHARDKLMAGELPSAFFFAKGSLFLGRMTQLSDGLSFLLRPNHESHKAGER